MTNADTDERVAAIEREMRREDPILIAAFERLGVFESDDGSANRLLLMASAVLVALAVTTMSPAAWVLGAVGLLAWKRT